MRVPGIHGKHPTLRDAVTLFERYNFRSLLVTDVDDRLLEAVRSRDMRGLRSRLA